MLYILLLLKAFYSKLSNSNIFTVIILFMSVNEPDSFAGQN